MDRPLSVFPDDGYTQSGTIPGVPGVSPPLVFSYRLASSAAVAEFLRQPQRSGAEEIVAAAKFVRPYLQFWDVQRQGPDGQLSPVEISEEALRQIGHRYLIGIQNHVQGYTSSQQEADLKN